jgi:hypothetical protein
MTGTGVGPNTPGVLAVVGVVGARGTEAGSLPHPAASSAKEAPTASRVTTFLVIEDMWPSLYQVNTRFQSSFPVLLDRSFSGRRCQHNLHRFLGMTVLDGWYKN